jgi:hypothetical protein
MRGCGRIGRPAFPAPSVRKAQKFWQTSGASRRENANFCLDVIACDKREAFAQRSAATKQSILSWRSGNGLLRFARNDEL